MILEMKIHIKVLFLNRLLLLFYRKIHLYERQGDRFLKMNNLMVCYFSNSLANSTILLHSDFLHRYLNFYKDI